MLVTLGTAVSPTLMVSCVTRPAMGARSSVLASCSRDLLQLRLGLHQPAACELSSSTRDWSRCERMSS